MATKIEYEEITAHEANERAYKKQCMDTQAIRAYVWDKIHGAVEQGKNHVIIPREFLPGFMQEELRQLGYLAGCNPYQDDLPGIVSWYCTLINVT